MKKYSKYSVVFLFLLVAGTGWAQTDPRKKLEQRKEQLLEEIRMNEQLLQNQKKKEKSAVDQILQQDAKIRLRQNLIETTEKQAKLLSNDISRNQTRINQLNKELKVLKEDYAQMIVKSYKSRSERSRAMFLLSSSNFLQAYKRSQYMKQYASYRQLQGEEIREKTQELEVVNKELLKQRKEKEQLIAENEKEKKVLERERQEQQKLVNSIKKDQKRITADIRKKQEEAKKIDREIQKLIREAIAASNKKAGNTGGSANKFALTPEGKIISDNFKTNKGKLPWPVKRGYVYQRFGNQRSPIEKNVEVYNSFVEIATEPGSQALAVFGGEVMSIHVYTPFNKAVLVQHGDFITIYQNLNTVHVAKGDKITIGQPLGNIHTNEATGKTSIKFSVLQNDTFLNPQQWLSNM